jgi:hypothetical protein
MSDLPPRKSRPVSTATVAVVLLGFALFLLPLYLIYVRHRPGRLFIPESAAAEKLSADQAWQATPGSRLAYLDDLRARQEKQLGSYAWIDRKAGVVQLPIDRAMELVVRQYGNKQP